MRIQFIRFRFNFLYQVIYLSVHNSHRNIDERVLGHVHIQGKRFILTALEK